MAPSFDIGNPQRSLVRVPGSGQDKSLQPTCLDVAQISNFSKQLSVIMKIDFMPPITDIHTGLLNMPLLQSSVVTGETQNSSQRVAHSSGAGAATQASAGNKRKRPDDDSPQPSKRPTINASLSPKEREEKKKRLEREKNTLLEENDDLARKVETFKSILRSRSKLKDFLTALEELPTC